mgnify:CR=1 FL=1
MRIKILCQNRVGILRDMLNLLVDYGINVARGEVGGEQGNAVYLHCPNLMNLQLQALRPKIEALPGVFELRKVSLMPSERHSLELNALLGALEFPVLSIDMSGAIVAANRAAAQLLGVRVDEVPGMSLSRYAEDFDLPELVRANKARINGLRVKIKGDVFLADIAPLQSEHDDSEALAGAVLTLHRADRVGERIYQVRKQELRGFDSIFQSSKVMAAVVREARRMAPLDAPLLIEGETGTGKELLARACHLSSPRGQSPFMALNCAGLPESMAETELFGYGPGAFEGARPEGKLGLLELTAGGTLFLDGVGEMSPRLQAKLLLEAGKVDAAIVGGTGEWMRHWHQVNDIIGKDPQVGRAYALTGVITQAGNLFFVDTHLLVEPTAEQVAEMTLLAAEQVHAFGRRPRAALLSHSSFGASQAPSAKKMRDALKLIRAKAPDLMVDGEMHADAALIPAIRDRAVCDSRLEGAANLLVFPNLDSANIAYNLVRVFTDGVAIGPILMGVNKPVHILTTSATSRRVLNMTAIAAVDAQIRKQLEAEKNG